MPVEDMEILHRIVAADRAARERYEAARQETDTFDERLEELGREVREAAMNDARARMEKTRAERQALADETLKKLDAERDAGLDSLRRRFAERKDEGVERVFRMVVGLDD